MRICLAQLNPVVGDLAANTVKLVRVLEENSQADLVVFPELSLTGYPPKDLLLRKTFLAEAEQNLRQIQAFSRSYPEIGVILGMPWRQENRLFNAAVFLLNGEILEVQYKQKLSRFRLFDETAYFSAGSTFSAVPFQDQVIGITLGLELDEQMATGLREQGVTLICNPAALPFQTEESSFYRGRFQAAAAFGQIPACWVNQVGGNDELIFPGESAFFSGAGKRIAVLPHFQEASLTFELNGAEEEEVGADGTAQIYEALVLGLGDYVSKSGMSKALIGLSGGLDSAVAVSLAAEALGAKNVWAITMPGPYSLPEGIEDARRLAGNLGIRLDELPITDLYQACLAALEKQFSGTAENVAEENIQARLRGNLLMALSNKFGGLVLTNSNKSELAVGYCTLYGDMSGGLAVIGDVYKTDVYKLAYYINRTKEIIPWNTIEKPPSAELRADQRDDDTLPPYEILDPIIRAYLDHDLAPEAIKEKGFDREIVDKVVGLIEGSEYKRRQAALILRVTSPLLGFDRRMPLAAKKL